MEAQEATARVGKSLGKTWQAKMDELMVPWKSTELKWAVKVGRRRGNKDEQM